MTTASDFIHALFTQMNAAPPRIEKKSILLRDMPFSKQTDYEYTITIPRSADTFKPEGLIIISSLSIEDIWSKIGNIILKIGSHTIIRLDRNILKIISDVSFVGNNHWLFHVNFNIFINDIPLAGLVFNEVYMKLYLTNSVGIDDIKLISKNILFDNDESRRLAYEPQSYHIQQIQGKFHIFEENSHIKHYINFSGVCKGYIIIGDINDIEHIRVEYDGQEIFSYDRTIINDIAKKIDETALYIPVNTECDWMDKSINSYAGGLDHSNYSSVMDIQFNTPKEQIGIYTINSNEFRCRNGMGYLKYLYID